MRLVVALVALLAVPVRAFAQPCTTPGPACSEWVKLGRGPGRSLVFRSYPLEAKNDRIRRALIVVHDTDRDAASYFQTALAAGFLASALDDAIIVAPRFASNAAGTGGCDDRLAPDEVNWPCEGNSWRSGGAAQGGVVTSFDLMDEIVRRLARRSSFPNLKVIVIAGHSAGGQFVTRYEMANRIHDSAGVPIRYVVANPSSYAYPDGMRPATVMGQETFRPFNGRACSAYDRWPYGLQNRSGYAARIPEAQLKRQLVSRPTTYLLGELDTLANAAFDASCPAMVQGATRLARGRTFAAYVARLGGHPDVTTVGLCGHNPRCMFTADAALAVLFPRVSQ